MSPNSTTTTTTSTSTIRQTTTTVPSLTEPLLHHSSSMTTTTNAASSSLTSSMSNDNPNPNQTTVSLQPLLLPNNESASMITAATAAATTTTTVANTTTTTISTGNDTDENHDQSHQQQHQQQQQVQRRLLELTNNIPTTTITGTTSTGTSRSFVRRQWDRTNIVALSSTTPIYITIGIPILILLTHVLFLHGQMMNMWSLIVHINLDVQYHATTYESQLTLDALKIAHSNQYTITDQTRHLRTFTYLYAMQELWQAKDMPGILLPRLASIGLMIFSGIWPHLKLLLLHFTWWTPFTNHKRRQRILSYLSILGKWSLVDVLVVCVMVGVLHLQYTFTAQHVMEMIQSHLSNVVTIIHTLYNADDLCSLALKYSCPTAKRVDHIIDCHTCISLIKTWFGHPDSVRDIIHGIDTHGGGNVQLSVIGLSGIYTFCGAVILSILLSFVVDYYDMKCRTNYNNNITTTTNNNNNNNNNNTNNNMNDALPGLEHHSVENHVDATTTTTRTIITQPEVITTTVSPTNITTCNDDCDDNDDAILNQLLLFATATNNNNKNNVENGTAHCHTDLRSTADRDFDRTIRIENSRTKHQIWDIISWMTIIVVISATLVITMERRVYGAIPMLLQDTFGVVWTKQYNFIELAYTTALAGRWDYLLMATFVWFIIAGPILRSILCMIANRYNETSTMSETTIVALYRTKRHLSVWIDFIGAFCAWEVFTVAVLMVDLLMPSITSTILIDPRCAQIVSHGTATSATTLNGSIEAKDMNCFEVEFDIMKNTFWMVLIGGVVLLLVSQHVRNNLKQLER